MKYKGKKRYDFGGFASADIAGDVPTNMGGGFSTPSDAPMDLEMLKKLAGPMSSMLGNFGKNNNSNKKQPITYNTGNAMSDYYLNTMEAEKQRNIGIGEKVGGGLGTLAGLGAGIGLAVATGGATVKMIPAFATAGNKAGKFGGSKAAEFASNINIGAFGGSLSTIPKSAGTHEQSPYGGVQLGNSNNYVEGGEAIHNGYVFSNRLKPMAMGGPIDNSDNKKSYADIAKKILKDKLGRADDRFSKKTANLYGSRLQAMQEEQREAMGLMDSNYGAYGIDLEEEPSEQKKKYNYIENYIQQLPEEDPGLPTIATKGKPKVTEDGLDYTGIDMPGGISGGVFSKKKPTPRIAKGVDDTDYKEYAKYLEDKMSNMSNKALWAKALPGALMQSAGPISAIAYGMRGPDDVSFERIKPNLINPKRVENLSRSALLRLMAGSKAGVKANAKTAGDLIAGYSAADNIYADQIGSMIGTPRMQADQLNMAAKNQIGAQNASIAMQESIARQQEKDAARSAITTGLSGVGAAGATGLKDARAEYSQANLNSQMLSLLPQLYSHFDFEKGDDGTIKMTPKVKAKSAFGGKLKTKRK